MALSAQEFTRGHTRGQWLLKGRWIKWENQVLREADGSKAT